MSGYSFILCNSSMIFISENKCFTSFLHVCNNSCFSAPKFVGEIDYMDEYVYQDNWKSYREVTISKNQVCEFSYTV